MYSYCLSCLPLPLDPVCSPCAVQVQRGGPLLTEDTLVSLLALAARDAELKGKQVGGMQGRQREVAPCCTHG
jgi:hypothetical protein